MRFTVVVELLFLGAPGLMMLLGAVAAVRWMHRRCPSAGQTVPDRTSTRLAAAVVEELTAFWYSSKRGELDHRAAQSMLRDEEAGGAPPRDRVDLDDRRAVLLARPPAVDTRA